MSTPGTIVNIFGVPFKADNTHTVFFSTQEERSDYLYGNCVYEQYRINYYKHGTPLQLKVDMIGVSYVNRPWNYVEVINPGDRPRFYFIKRSRYISDNCIELDLELDVIQTYLFETSFLPCYVERQHTETDVIGEHTVDEGLELGELVNNYVADVEELQPLAIMAMTSITMDAGGNFREDDRPGWMISGVFSGLDVYATGSSDCMAEFLKALNDEDLGAIDAVVTMWMYPRALVELDFDVDWNFEYIPTGDGANEWHEGIGPVIDTIELDRTFAKRYDLDGYRPRNNKLYCYPYNFLYISNNSGGAAVYRYERFTGGDCQFTIKGALTPDSGVRMQPNHYNGTGDNYDAGISLGGFPTCAWAADPYKIWLAQNSNQLQLGQNLAGVKIASGAVTAIGSIAMGNVFGAGAGIATAVSGFTQIAAQNAQKADMDAQPPQARGSLSVSVNAAHGKLTFTSYAKSVNAEHAKIIDDFFTMYGYKLNRVMVPNRYARNSFTYIKTVGCMLNNTGSIPTEDAEKIAAIHDAGITYWRPNVTLGDYSVNNDERDGAGN